MKNIINEKPTDELHGRTRFILSFIDKEDIQGKKMLDIGCGFGWFEYGMIKKDVCHVTGIDMTKADITMNKAYFKNNCDVDFKLGSAIDLPFESETFDTVVAWDVIEHIPLNTEVVMLKEIARVLKPNGTFYISTPYKSFVGTVLDPAWWLTKHRHYNVPQIEMLIEKTQRLCISCIKIRGGVWDILNMLNLYSSKWIFRRRRFFADYFNRKIDAEYEENGINTLFVKGKKSNKFIN